MGSLSRRRVFLGIVLACAVATTTRAQWGPMPVAVAPVESHDVPPALRLVGTVYAERKAVVAAEVSGAVAAFEANEGDFLKAGDVICRLDDTLLKFRVAEAAATLAGLQARLEELERGERPEEIARLEAVVAEADAQSRKWEFERKRVAALLERGQGSDKEMHDTEMECLAAAGRLAAARAQLERARNGARAEEIARARHDVHAQQAVLGRWQRDLDRTTVRAPFSGALVAKRTDVGEWLTEGKAVCELVALDVVKVRVNVPESVIGFARAGAPAQVAVEALSRSIAGQVTRVIPQASETARSFPVEIDLPNADHSLLPGMFVWAYVPAGPAGERLMVPKDAVVTRGAEKTIYVVRHGQDGTPTAMPTAVETGLELAGLIEVQAPGLAAGDQVVVRANERLMRPTPVVPTPWNHAETPAGGAPAEPSADKSHRATEPAAT